MMSLSLSLSPFNSQAAADQVEFFKRLIMLTSFR
jgi:hypothetical protein